MSFELYERRKGEIEDTEDGRTPWRLSGLSSKKGRRQTLADFGQESYQSCSLLVTECVVDGDAGH